MLTPSSKFTAKEIRFLQTNASMWINHINEKIIDAAGSNLTELNLSIWDNVKQDYEECTHALEALIEHFRQRGFNVKLNGQSSIIINWQEQ